MMMMMMIMIMMTTVWQLFRCNKEWWDVTLLSDSAACAILIASILLRCMRFRHLNLWFKCSNLWFKCSNLWFKCSNLLMFLLWLPAMRTIFVVWKKLIFKVWKKWSGCHNFSKGRSKVIRRTKYSNQDLINLENVWYRTCWNVTLYMSHFTHQQPSLNSSHTGLPDNLISRYVNVISL